MPLYDDQGDVTKIISTLDDITETKRVQQALLASAFKLRNHNLALTQLARNPAIYNGDLTAALRKITQAAASNIQVERTRFWLYQLSMKQQRSLVSVFFSCRMLMSFTSPNP